MSPVQRVSEEIENNPLYNKPAKNISFFTPAQNPPAGTFINWNEEAKQHQSPPKVFTPIKIRGVTLPNRVWLSPLCQYSADDGHLTPWHLAHLGGIVSRGPGVICVEATAVHPAGRITPEDSGIWSDAHIESHAKVVEYVHSQNKKIIIQLAHAGRKASTAAPWISRGAEVPTELGGWPGEVIAPSAIKFAEAYPQPRAMTEAEINDAKQWFVDAAKRAIKAGYDGIELHMAHGYLLHEFASGVSNYRTDNYGGSFENRTRLHLEITKLIRATIPEDMPLFARISASDHLESNSDPELASRSWKLEESTKLASLLADAGVDVIDVSSGGNHPQQKVAHGPAYQAPLAFAVKEKVGDRALVSTVGGITSGKQAEELLQKGLDMVACGRLFMANPGGVFEWADELEVKVRMPNQIGWAFPALPVGARK